MDYLIPTVSKDYVGLIPRPCQADRALRWLKEALHRQGGLDPKEFRDLSWHSFRVFIPDCAFQLGMPRDQRQYLGNWSSESTADIYTREKRKVVERAWTAVADQLDRLNLSTRPDKPVDLQHTEWMDVIRVEEDHGASMESTPKRAKTGSPASKSGSDWAKISMASSDALVDIEPSHESMPARCFRQGTQWDEGAALPIDTHAAEITALLILLFAFEQTIHQLSHDVVILIDNKDVARKFAFLLCNPHNDPPSAWEYFAIWKMIALLLRNLPFACFYSVWVPSHDKQPDWQPNLDVPTFFCRHVNALADAAASEVLNEHAVCYLLERKLETDRHQWMQHAVNLQLDALFALHRNYDRMTAMTPPPPTQGVG